MLVGLARWIIAPREHTAPPRREHKAKGAYKEVVELTRKLV